jgi:hypothetical protein
MGTGGGGAPPARVQVAERETDHSFPSSAEIKDIYILRYIYRAFQKELYNGISNVSVWRVLRKCLHLKAYKLFKRKPLRNACQQSNKWNTTEKLFLKHPALPVEVTLNRNYARQNTVCFATLRQFKTLYMSSK